tara:strand:+ start:3614 stop:3955 length:342 start_codon:yes stop_codon:yes gene_type:complete
MSPAVIVDLDNSNAGPMDRIYTHEFIEGVLKAGSFISMLEGKKINVTTLFLLILQNKNYQEFFTEVTASDNFREAVLSLLCLHPTLVKSKFTKSFIRKVNVQKSADRFRKIDL